LKSVEPGQIIDEKYLEDTSIYLLPSVENSLDDAIRYVSAKGNEIYASVEGSEE